MHQYRLPAVTASYPPTRDDDHEHLLGNQPELVFDAPEDEPGQEGELVPYAHRDIKPGWVPSCCFELTRQQHYPVR